MKLKCLMGFAVFSLFVSTLSAESYAFRLTRWADIENSWRLEIFEFDIHTQPEFDALADAFEKDPDLIKISTTFKELMANLGRKSIAFDKREYNYFPYGIIVNTATPFLVSTRDTALESRFTFTGTLGEVSGNEFAIDYSYERFGTVAFSVKRKQNIVLGKMYFIASTWNLPKK